MEERRLAADAGHDDRLAALDDAAGDALAELIGDGAGSAADPVRGFDAQLAVGLEQRDDAAHGAVVAGEDFEDAMEGGLLIERARQRLADVEQRGEAAGFAGDGVGGRSAGPGPGGARCHPTILSVSLIQTTFLSPLRRPPIR